MCSMFTVSEVWGKFDSHCFKILGNNQLCGHGKSPDSPVVVMIIIFYVLCNVQLYQDLNIRVVLVDVTTWTNGDQINVVSDAGALLDNFERYKPQITAQHDSAMLIT